MSLGRTSTFLDIYFERDLKSGALTEEQAQEIIDDFVIKLRIVRFLRTPEYDDLFAGDPTWVTESIAGLGDDGRPLVTKTSFRYLHTLYNLGPAPEPNLTIWYSPRLPDGFRSYAAKVAIEGLAANSARVQSLRDRLIDGVLTTIDDVYLNGAIGDARLPGNTHFTFRGCEGDSLLMLLDAKGVECSTGSACTAGVAQPSHVLLAMGVDPASARGSLRLSFGHTSTEADVDAALAVLPAAVERARQAALASAGATEQ